jgi:hypothetical protein
MILFHTLLNTNSGTIPPTEVLSFYLAGQSNAVSRNVGTEIPLTDLQSNGEIQNAYYWGGSDYLDYTLQMNQYPDYNGGFGVEYRIAQQFLDNQFLARVNLLKYAKGASSIGGGGCWDSTSGACTNGVIAEHNNTNQTPKFFIWIQGENDAISQVLGDAYEVNLRNFVNRIYTDINPDYFVIMELGYFTNANQTHATEVRTAQNIIANENVRTIFVDANQTPSLKADGIHYDLAGQDDMAYRIYNVIKDL